MRIGGRTALRLIAAVAGLTFGTVVAPAVAEAPELAMLDGLARGTWVLHSRGDGAHGRICVHSGRELIQIHHRNKQCSHYVVDDKPDLVTVQYTCPGEGYGRTTIRRETPRLVQIDSQGIDNGMPFHIHAEARRAGEC
jgi:hypothetical protein